MIQGLQAAGADRHGFIVYPLVEFGMQIPPIMHKADDLKSMAVFSGAGFALTAQSNSLDGAFERLREMSTALGITASIDRSAIEHHARAGNMKWLTRNPLMVVRLASHTGDYYENQFVYTLKIRMAAAQTLMLYAMSVDAGFKNKDFETSARVNNWETLDVRHYLIGEATHPDKPLDIRRVPMNVGALELARLSDLAVTLSTRMLAKAEAQAWAQRLTTILRSVEYGYLSYVNLGSKARVHIRVYRRIVTALDWYKQSFGARMKEFRGNRCTGRGVWNAAHGSLCAGECCAY